MKRKLGMVGIYLGSSRWGYGWGIMENQMERKMEKKWKLGRYENLGFRDVSKL